MKHFFLIAQKYTIDYKSLTLKYYFSTKNKQTGVDKKKTSNLYQINDKSRSLYKMNYLV